MAVTDFVKSGFLNKGHIAAANEIIHPAEKVRYATTLNCKINGGKRRNCIIVITTHRLIVADGNTIPPQAEAFPLSDELILGTVQPGFTPVLDFTLGEKRIFVEGTKDDLFDLRQLVENAIAAFSGQEEMNFDGFTPRASLCESQKIKYPPQTTISSKDAAKQRIAENRASGVACCPKCGSTSISANKKGFSLGKAAAGAFVAGPVGLVGGTLGANKVMITCLNCGYKYKPGKK